MIASTVLAGLLRALSLLASAEKFKESATVARVLSLAAFAVERGEAGRHALEVLCAKIDEMVAQGREPTAEEWAGLRARSDTAHEAIQKAADEVRPDENAPEPDKVGSGSGKGGQTPTKEK